MRDRKSTCRMDASVTRCMYEYCLGQKMRAPRAIGIFGRDPLGDAPPPLLLLSSPLRRVPRLDLDLLLPLLLGLVAQRYSRPFKSSTRRTSVSTVSAAVTSAWPPPPPHLQPSAPATAMASSDVAPQRPSSPAPAPSSNAENRTPEASSPKRRATGSAKSSDKRTKKRRKVNHGAPALLPAPDSD